MSSTPPKSVRAAAAVLSLVLTGGGAAQFLSPEAAENAAWEDFLKSAKIAGSEQLSGPDATTRPLRLSLEKDGRAKFGLWKNVDVSEGGFTDTWRYEIAAYRLDRLLGLDMIPPTVERRVSGEKGSLQLWIDGTATLKKKTADGTSVPADKMADWNRWAYVQRAFDSLIGNEDRNANNILVTEDWRTLLIDHSRSFRTKKAFTERLIFGEGGLLRAPDGSPYPLAPLPRSFFEKIKGLDAAKIRKAVGRYLVKGEVDACLARAALIVKEIESLIQRQGEGGVLY